MASIIEQIEKDFLIAYKAKEEVPTSTLRMLKSAIKNAEIAKKEPLTDDEAVRLIQKEVKQRKDAIDLYAKGGRSDLANKDQQEIELLSNYLPKQISEEELVAIVSKIVSDINATTKKDFGRAMGEAMKQVGSRAQGSDVSKILNQLLTQ